MNPRSLPEIATEFLKYAERDYHGSSPLYEALALSVAKDTDLLEIASHGPSAIPNLFFAAVHYLLIRFRHEALAEYYPSLQRPAKVSDDLFPALRAFCMRYRTELIEIVSTRLVQTNEVSRCPYLYPAFVAVAKLGGGAPLAMIDLGTSAGLHLCWDRYAYDHGLGRLYGDSGSPVRIEAVLRGNRVPKLDEAPTTIDSRIGIDLRPIRPDDQDGINWLGALIWPEHEWRRRLFREAIPIVEREQSTITLLAGDVATVLPGVLDDVPQNVIPCVFQTHIGRELSEKTKSQLTTTLENFRRTRKFFFVSARSRLGLEYFAPNERRRWSLANYEQHGRWIEWLGGDLRHS